MTLRGARGVKERFGIRGTEARPTVPADVVHRGPLLTAYQRRREASKEGCDE